MMLTLWISKVKSALASRYLFDNWFALLISYALVRLGFNAKLKARISDRTIEIDPEVFAHLVSSFSRRQIRSIKSVANKLFVNDVEVNDINDVVHDVKTFAKVLGWNYDDVSNCWVKNGVRFRHMHQSILGVFDYGEYQHLNVNGRVVYDIGAFVGDSPIYFALKGAKRVIALEPNHEAFKEMLENIRLNKLQNVITPVNAGLAGKPGYALKMLRGMRTQPTYHRVGECNCEIPAITLGELISKYGLDNYAVLKMDCEGCEYDIILNDYEHVKAFKELIFEYHEYAVSKPVSKLLKVLGQDYHCKVLERHKKWGTGIVYSVRR